MLAAMEAVEIITVALTALGMAGSFVVAAVKFSARLAKIELKGETMWEFIMQRALKRGLEAGVIEKNSPVKSTGKLDQYFSNELHADLYRLWVNELQYLPDDNARTLRIQEKYGKRIFDEVCLPAKEIGDGECLLVALALAKIAPLYPRWQTPETEPNA